MGFWVDRLEPLYAEHGLRLRKHTGQFPAWTERVPTVVDLDDEEHRILDEEGERALDDHLRERGMFAFPALDVRRLNPLHRRSVLSRRGVRQAAVFVGPGGGLRHCAESICEMVRDLDGSPPTIHPDTEWRLIDLCASHAIVLGGAHENAAAARLCDRGWLDADLRFPGPGGWLLRTVHNPAGMGHNLVHLCADESTCEPALEALRNRLARRGDSVVLGPAMEAHPGPAAMQWLGDWEIWRRHFASAALWRRGEEYRDIEDVEGFARWLAGSFDCGGPKGDLYNRGPARVGSMAARLYTITGDRRCLELYRHLMLALMDYYCNFEGGASYLGDFDFEVYSQILYWDLLEEEDVFSDEERLIITNFLLATLRMTRGHQRERWPIRPGALRHNHETFPALGLFRGGCYFSDYYGLTEAEDWLETAEEAFSGTIEDRVKHREDANGYQWIVPSHKLLYDALTGRDTYRENGVLAGLARALVATTDNLGHPADFGDAGLPISSGTRQAALLEAIAGRLGDAAMQWWADRLWRAVPGSDPAWLGGALMQINAGRRVEPEEPAPPPRLDVLPLDDHIRRMAAPELPASYVYDKAALRDGHDPRGQYLLLDGYSVGSHIHYDQNAIIRYTAAERLWLVDNGYGKPSGETAAQAAYAGRQRGPQDHNTLLVLHDDEPALPPPFCALLVAESDGPLSLVQSALVGYAGVDWLRSIIWLSGYGALVIDSVNVEDEVRELRCQLNMLGQVEVEDGLLRCEQDGRHMLLQFEPGARVEMGSYTNANWDAEFERGSYPHASPPVKKFERVVAPEAGETLRFVTLIQAGDEPEPRMELELGEDLTVRGELPAGEGAVSAAGLEAAVREGTLSVRIDAPWPVPTDIPRLPAQSPAYALTSP